MLSSNADNRSPFRTPGTGNLNPTSEADRSPSSHFLHDHHDSRSTPSLQGEFSTHGAKRRRRELVLRGVGGTRRKLNFWASPPESHKSLPQPPPAAAYRFDLSDCNITASPFPVPSPSGVKLRSCSTDHSNDQRGQMLHDASANQPFNVAEYLVPKGKRFIDWIRKVDKFIIGELQRVKHNPNGNKKAAKRERRISILMSMR